MSVQSDTAPGAYTCQSESLHLDISRLAR